MANFLIQTINGLVRHDFSFALMEAIDYQNWLNAGSHDYVLVEMKDMFLSDYSEFIPSGTIQFIKKFISTYHDINDIKPINIPNDLNSMKYLKRKVDICNNLNANFSEDYIFVKSMNNLKGFTDIIKGSDISKLPNNTYLISETIDIESEWRSFIFNKKLVGIQNYLGDFCMMPDVKLINQMIDDYKYSPLAYTLDIGVNNKDGTFLIEVHNMYSVGTYGFSQNRILPQMFIAGFKYLIENKY